MKELGETLRDELVRQPWVSIVELRRRALRSIDRGIRESLQRYQLTFDQVAAAVALPLLTCRLVQSSGTVVIC